MDFHIPSWALYAAGLVAGCSFVLKQIHASLYPQVEQQFNDLISLRALVVSNHEANKDKIETVAALTTSRLDGLSASSRATNYTVAQLALATPPPAAGVFDPNKTTVLQVLPVEEPVVVPVVVPPAVVVAPPVVSDTADSLS